MPDPGTVGPDNAAEPVQFQSRAQLMLNRLLQARQGNFSPEQAPLFNQPGPQPGAYGPAPGFRSRRFNRANQMNNPQSPVPPGGPS